MSVVVGAVSYLLFRDNTQGNVVASLGSGNVMVTMVRALLCVDLLFTAPMLLAIGRELVETSLFHRQYWFTQHYPETTRNILRSCLVIAIIAASYGAFEGATNAFYNVVSLVGGICGFTLGFIYPPSMYLKLYWLEISPLTKGFNIFIITLGAVLLVASTYVTVQQF